MAVDATERHTQGPVGGEHSAAKVLIVDDRYDNVLALEASLQGMPVRPVRALSGEEALKRLLVDDFALILLDVQMPHMDGFETAQHIKRRERTRHVPIIFLTAADREAQLALRGYATGAVDYITKPFDPWMLRAKVAVFVELWTKTQRLRAHVEAQRACDAELAGVSRSLREAVALVGVLRSGSREAPSDPDRQLAQLSELLDQARAGLAAIAGGTAG
ncbi:MAG: response regulator [Micromonosporaceae bacterium]|nr:response regulator [Micromonosporaceae bacterium]